MISDRLTLVHGFVLLVNRFSSPRFLQLLKVLCGRGFLGWVTVVVSGGCGLCVGEFVKKRRAVTGSKQVYLRLSHCA